MKTVFDVKNQFDQDLFVKMVCNDTAHIGRAKAKAAGVAARKEADRVNESFEVAARWCTLGIVGSFVLCIAAVLAMV